MLKSTSAPVVWMMFDVKHITTSKGETRSSSKSIPAGHQTETSLLSGRFAPSGSTSDILFQNMTQAKLFHLVLGIF